MKSKRFQKTVEAFVCENCGQTVTGSGYTNHCPACLWSKHVDVQPGDRAENCSGMMQPVGVEKKSSKYRILQRCLNCGKEKWNKVSKDDDFEMIMQIIGQQALGE